MKIKTFLVVGEAHAKKFSIKFASASWEQFFDVTKFSKFISSTFGKIELGAAPTSLGPVWVKS